MEVKNWVRKVTSSNGEKMMKLREVSIKKVSKIGVIMTLVSVIVISSFIVWNQRQFLNMQVAMDRYTECELATQDITKSLDTLTENARLYVATSDRNYMKLYCEEVEVSRRREHAMKKINKWFENTDAMVYLNSTTTQIDNLKELEIHAIKLAAEANQVDEDLLSDTVKKYRISKAEQSLNREEKMNYANELINGANYRGIRSNIMRMVNNASANIIMSTTSSLDSAKERYHQSFYAVNISVGILLIFLLASSFTTYKLILIPIEKYKENIVNGEELSEAGVSELRTLAKTYNQIYQEKKENESLLRHEAEHDALTGLYNRRSFSKLLHLYEKGKLSFGLALVDIDIFKKINDNYGHEIGDQIIKKVAFLLEENFRSVDFPCRIGGDEFAVLMVETSSEAYKTLEEKIYEINRMLSNPEDGLPPTSLSVGIAFSDSQHPVKNIYKNADDALYDVKEHGRCGCRLYEN